MAKLYAYQCSNLEKGESYSMPGDIRPTVAAFQPDIRSLIPDAPLSRRGFVVSSLSVGFAAAA